MNCSQKIICFDYYRTLVELESPFESIRHFIGEYLTCHENGIDREKFYSRFTRYRASLSTDTEFRLGIDLLLSCLVKTCDFFGIRSFTEAFKAYIEVLFSSPAAYHDSFETLSRLKEFYRVGLLTNADNYILEESIRKQGFTFDFVLTSEDARCNKPGEGIFKYALQQLDAKAEDVIMVGDSPFDDIYGASRLGIKTIWVNRNHELPKEGMNPPDFEVKALHEIIKILA